MPHMNQSDLRTMPVLDESFQNVKHPFANYCVGDAIAFAVNNAKTFGGEVPTTLRELRDGHNQRRMEPYEVQ